MKCIIIDDEPFGREGILLNVKELPFLEVAGEFTNAIEASNFLMLNKIDLMFLDIEMPGISGLDFLKSLKNPPLTILTTAYSEYALDSYDLGVVDYLVKPIRLARFIKAVQKAKELYDTQQLAKGAPIAESTLSPIAVLPPIESEEKDYMFIKSDRKFVKLLYSDIVFIKGMKDYVTVYTTNTKLMIAMNIKTIHDQLPWNIFARVSKSHIINIDFIDNVDGDGINLKDNWKEIIPLGDTYKEEFINNYIKNNLVQRK